MPVVLQDASALPAVKRSKKKSTSRAGAKAEAGGASDDIYIVPEDFDPAVLGQPDFSSREEAERAMADLFVKRWWDLREQVGHCPPNPIPFGKAALPLLAWFAAYWVQRLHTLLLCAKASDA